MVAINDIKKLVTMSRKIQYDHEVYINYFGTCVGDINIDDKYKLQRLQITKPSFLDIISSFINEGEMLKIDAYSPSKLGCLNNKSEVSFNITDSYVQITSPLPWTNTKGEIIEPTIDIKLERVPDSIITHRSQVLYENDISTYSKTDISNYSSEKSRYFQDLITDNIRTRLVRSQICGVLKNSTIYMYLKYDKVADSSDVRVDVIEKDYFTNTFLKYL